MRRNSEGERERERDRCGDRVYPCISRTDLQPWLNKRIARISISENYIRFCPFRSRPKRCLLTSLSCYIGRARRVAFSLSLSLSFCYLGFFGARIAASPIVRASRLRARE